MWNKIRTRLKSTGFVPENKRTSGSVQSLQTKLLDLKTEDKIQEFRQKKV